MADKVDPKNDKAAAETPAEIKSDFQSFWSEQLQQAPKVHLQAPSAPALAAAPGDACSAKPGQVPCPGGAAFELPVARKTNPLDAPRVTSKDDFSRNVSADDRSVTGAPLEPVAPSAKGERTLGTSLEITPPVYTQPDRGDEKRKDADAPGIIEIPSRIQPAPVEVETRQSATPAERLLRPEKTTRIEAPQVGEPERVQAPALPVRSDKDAPDAPIEKLYTQPIQSDTRQSETHVPTFQPEAPAVVTPRVEPTVKTEPAAKRLLKSSRLFQQVGWIRELPQKHMTASRWYCPMMRIFSQRISCPAGSACLLLPFLGLQCQGPNRLNSLEHRL